MKSFIIEQNIMVIDKYFKLFLKRELKKYDLTIAEAMALLILFNKNREVFNLIHDDIGETQEQMAKQLSYDKSVMTRTMKLLENRGYVIRNTNNKDNRSYVFALTKKAEKLEPILLDVLERWNDQILKNVEDISVIKKSLLQMAENAKKCN